MERFGLSPLIRFTLLSLYLALVLPLPLLAPQSLRLWMGVGLDHVIVPLDVDGMVWVVHQLVQLIWPLWCLLLLSVREILAIGKFKR